MAVPNAAPQNTVVGPRDLTAAQRRELAFQLRLAHKSWYEIGRTLGVSHKAAYMMVQRTMVRRAQDRLVDADKLRAQEITRCEEVEAALWPHRGEAKESLALLAWVNKRQALQGFVTEAPPPVIDRETLKQAVAEALGITVLPPKQLPASQRVVEVAADAPRPVEEGLHGRGVG